MAEVYDKAYYDEQYRLIGNLYEQAKQDVQQLHVDSNRKDFVNEDEWQARFNNLYRCINELRAIACINVNEAHSSIKTEN